MIMYKECCNMLFQYLPLVFESNKKLCLSLEQLVIMRRKQVHYKKISIHSHASWMISFFRSIKHILLHAEKKVAVEKRLLEIIVLTKV